MEHSGWWSSLEETSSHYVVLYTATTKYIQGFSQFENEEELNVITLRGYTQKKKWQVVVNNQS